jgi:flavorubredoxin
MKAIVVYESLWGNTAAVARAIAEGLGDGARAVTTDEATGAVLGEADLVVAGAPVLGFRLPTEDMRQSVVRTEFRAPHPADLSHPSMRSWLEGLPPVGSDAGVGEAGSGARFAAFETGLWWSPGGATKAIGEKLTALGYRPVEKGHRFVVKGRYGPLRNGELDKARAWGQELAKSVG